MTQRSTVFFNEEQVWKELNPDELWVLDKLILSRKLGYNCGPVGVPVTKPGWYIVRPTINPNGLGLGTQRVWINDSTDHLPLGHFWCEEFEGEHYSVDYDGGHWSFTVQGYRDPHSFTHWEKWVKIDKPFPIPAILKPFVFRYPFVNCEFIGDKLIEVHLRPNPDFLHANSIYVPVWEGQSTEPPPGYYYIHDPDIHGRIGAFIC